MYLPSWKAERARLGEEKSRRHLEKSARDWLGLGQDWSELGVDCEVIPAWAVPHWMQPGGPVDRRTRVVPGQSERRKLQFEVVWLEDIDQALSAKCKEHWSDDVSETDGFPAFVKEQMVLEDPPARRRHLWPSFAQWRDHFRIDLDLSEWKLDFDNLYHINQRIDPCRIDKRLLSTGAEEPKGGDDKDDDDAPKYIRLISTEDEEPYLSWDKFVEFINAGHDLLTIAFTCRPCATQGPDYPWETESLQRNGFVSTPVDSECLKKSRGLTR